MQSNSGIITIPGLASVNETMGALEKALTAHGISIYARIDQQAEAEKAGMNLKPLRLLIFGNPKGGIPLMNANPLCGLDLPLKVIVWQDDEKKIWASYNSFPYLQNRFDLPADLIQKISGTEKIIQRALQG